MRTVSTIRVGQLASFPPRECGIATFTKDLVDATDAYPILKPTHVIAVNEFGSVRQSFPH